MTSGLMMAVGAALDGIEVGYCICDAGGHVLVSNAAFLHLFPEHQGVIRVEGQSDASGPSDALHRSVVESAIAGTPQDGMERHGPGERSHESTPRHIRMLASSSEVEALGRVHVWRKVTGLPELPTVTSSSTPPQAPLADALRLDSAAVLERLADGVLVVDIAQQVVWANSAFLQLYGLRSISSACGQRFQSIFRAAWSDQAQDPAFSASLAALLDISRPAETSFELNLPGDRFVRVIEHQVDHEGRTYSEHVDISHLRRQQAALAVAEQRYRLLAEYSSDIILSVEGGAITYASPAVTELLGWDADGVLGTPVVGYCHPADVSPIARALQATDGSQSQIDYRARVRHRDGRYVWVEARARNLPGETGSLITRRIVNLRGIDARKAVEDELELAKERLLALATTDPLTGLANRRRLDDVLFLEFRRSQREALPLSALLIDIDHFKLLNDAHGHAVGDQVLKVVAALLQTVAQRAGDLVVRLGGDEFLVVLPGAESAQAVSVAHDLVRKVGQAVFAPPVERVTVSVGVSTLVPASAVDSTDALLVHADKALYEAKRSGRNRVVVLDVHAGPPPTCER